MTSCLERNDNNELLIRDSGCLNISSRYPITRENFLKVIISSSKIITDYDEFFNIEDLNIIIYLEMFNAKNDNYEIYLKNSLIHNSCSWAWKIKNINFYYFHGVEYKYDEWLVMPERVRESRDLKLQLI
jgi:hypothetical protein